jgi:16S rRNA (guanine527-N7)-methyltransferase
LRVGEDLAISNNMTDLLQTHKRLLERYRKAMNLVGPGPTDFHYEDAKRTLRPLSPEGHWADMGTGAGFPGIVFAHLFPSVALDLVDSRQKRCWFLNQVLQQTQLDPKRAPIHVHCSRIETLPTGPYDGVIARALAKPEEVMNLTASFIKIGGLLVLPLQQSQQVTALATFKHLSDHPYTIEGKERKTALFQRVLPD